VQLHIHAEITTEDGKKIALAADGVALLDGGSPVGQLRENVTLTTSDADYSWVNPLQVWAPVRSIWRRVRCGSRATPPDV
jgi:hypothetical protein